MPIYEFRCHGCGHKVSILFRRIGEEEGAACPRCGSSNLERLVSRFALARSEEDRLERLAEPSTLEGLDENDPKSMARWAKRMAREMGEEGGEDVDQIIDEIERGEMSGEGPGAEDEPAGAPAAGDDL